MQVQGGCHCGGVRFTIETEQTRELIDCNCTICAKSGYLHLNVLHDKFTLNSGEDLLSSYRYGSGQAEHLFCKICGIKSFYQPRSPPGCWSVNFNYVDDGHGLSASSFAFDGRNWEKNVASISDK